MKCYQCGKNVKKIYFSMVYDVKLCSDCMKKYEDYEDYFIKESDNMVNEVVDEVIDLGEEY